MNTKFYFPILALALSVAACNDKKAATQTGGIDVANLDRSVTPNQDFYQFACGGWMQAHPLTDEYGRFGSFDLLAENNRKQMQGLIEELAAKKSEPGSVARKIGDLYNMAMDTVKLNGDGSTPIQPVLEKIKAVKTPKEMVTLVAEMTRQGFGPYFGIYIGPDDMNSSMNLVQTYQGGLGLGDRDYYLKEDEHSKEIRTKYQEHIVKMFELAGWEEKEARQAAADVMAIETRLAEAAYEKVKMRDPHANYHKMSVEELKKEIPGIDWEVYFATLGLQGITELNLGQPEPVKEVARILNNTDLKAQQAYLEWKVIDAAALHDALMEQAVRRRGLHQRPDLHTAAGLTENRNILRVSAECRDIVMYPLQCSYHICVSCIRRIFVFFAKRREIEITEDIQPMVHGNNNDITELA